MSKEAITEEEFDLALEQMKRGLAEFVCAYQVLRRFTLHGILNESETQVDRYADDISKLRTRIQKTADLRRKLKQRAKRKREIDVERRKTK